MFATIVKATTKVGTLVIAAAAIIALFSVVTVPAIDLSPAFDMIILVYSICNHYFPFFPLIWTLGLVLLSLEVSYLLFKLGAIAWKWIIKVASD